MKATLIHGGSDIRVEDVPDPVLSESTDAVVRVLLSCICGSDLWGYRRPGPREGGPARIGHEFLCDHGAYPSTLGYRGFPKSLCSSVNEVVCHGIPDDRVVEDGDVVTLRAVAPGPEGSRIGLGEVTGRVVPAR